MSSMRVLQVVLVVCSLSIVLATTPSARSGALEPLDAPLSSKQPGTVLASLSSTSSSNVAAGVTLEDGGRLVEVTDKKGKKRVILSYPPELNPFNLFLCCVWKTPTSKLDGRTIVDCSRIDCVKQSKRVSELALAASLKVDSSNTELLHVEQAKQERLDGQRLINEALLKAKLQGKAQTPLKSLNVNTFQTIQPSVKSQQPGPSRQIYAAAAAARRLLNEETEGMDSGSSEEAESVDGIQLLETSESMDSETPYQGLNSWLRREVWWAWDAGLAALTQKRRDNLQASFTQGINDWMQRTCVTWREHDPALNALGVFTSLGFVTAGNSHVNDIGFDINRATHICVIRVDWRVLMDSIRPDAHHELGHVLGLEHTQKRRDHARYITTHLAIGGDCANDWCRADSIDAGKKISAWVNAEIVALQPAVAGFTGRVNALIAAPVPGGLSADETRLFQFKIDAIRNMKAKPRYSGKLSLVSGLFASAIGDAFTEDDVRSAFAYAECAYGMDHQYRPLPDVTLTSAYDFRSIMHYYLGNCMTANVPTPAFPLLNSVGKPGGISDLDSDAVCQMYGCYVHVRIGGNSAGVAVHGVLGAATAWEVQHFFVRTTTLAQVRAFVADFVQAHPNNGLPHRPVAQQYELLDPASVRTQITTGNLRVHTSNTALNDNTLTLEALVNAEVGLNVAGALANQVEVAAGRGVIRIEYH